MYDRKIELETGILEIFSETKYITYAELADKLRIRKIGFGSHFVLRQMIKELLLMKKIHLVFTEDGRDVYSINLSTEESNIFNEKVEQQNAKISFLEAQLLEIMEFLNVKRIAPKLVVGSDIKNILDLPSHLQRTLRCLEQIGQGTAGDISSMTKIARPVESTYLNQLVREKYIFSRRNGRKKIFFLGESGQ